MARIDWALHKEQFERYRAENPALTLTQYCSNNGLSVATARRHIKARDTGNNTPPKARKVRSSASANSERANQSGKTSKASKGKASAQGKAHARATKKAKSEPESNPKYQKKSEKQDTDKVPVAPKKSAAQTRRDKNKKEGFERPVQKKRWASPFAKGNKLAMTHGGYARLESIDPELQDMAIMQCGEGASYIEVISVARMLQMDRYANELIEEIDERENFYESLLQSSPEDVTPETIEALETLPSKAKRRADILMGMSDRFNSTLSLAHFAKNDREKNYLKYHELHPMDARDRFDMTRQLFGQIKSEELGPVDAARLFEVNGLKVPEILAQEAKKEISLREPDLDQGGTVTEEEIAQEEAAFIEDMATMEQQIAKRQEEIEALIQKQIAAEEDDPDPDDLLEEGDDENPEFSVGDFDQSEDEADKLYDEAPDGDYDA